MPAPVFSSDQEAAWEAAMLLLERAGIDMDGGGHGPVPDRSEAIAVLGKAGSGKTLLLAELASSLKAAGVRMVSGDWEGKRREGRRTCAILAPTNKAAFVLRMRGVPATTIHRIIYTPVYDPDYEAVAEWLAGEGERPVIELLSDEALDKAAEFYATTPSIPGALAAVGLKGSDFITGWSRRKDPLDIGLIDEASMLDERLMDDLTELFPTLILFGDPAQLAPVNAPGGMVFDALPETRKRFLGRVHRQEADNPIIDLAHALQEPGVEFHDFERMVEEAAAKDDRVVLAQRAEASMMARSPMLVWTNKTRIRLIQAFRAAYGAPETELLPGEPLICDGIELPLKHRKKRIDLEARGLVKGAQCVYVGPGRKPGFSKLHVIGAEQPQVSVSSIVRIEKPNEEEPFIPYAARMGAVFLHGAACTIHKAQGSQWDEVQVFAPDLYVAAKMGRTEAGQPLWKRLAYVAITRAAERLHWVTRARLGKPEEALGTEDLAAPEAPMTLTAPESD